MRPFWLDASIRHPHCFPCCPSKARRQSVRHKASFLINAAAEANTQIRSASSNGSAEPDETSSPDAPGFLKSQTYTLEDDNPSIEIQDLCRLQLDLLATSLHLSLDTQKSLADDLGGQTLNCTAYRRVPSSLRTGELQLQLVAATEKVNKNASLREDLFLGAQGPSGEQENWILSQGVIVLPDSGGLVLPLSHSGFLVGMLVVERCGDKLAGFKEQSDLGNPPACHIFGSIELSILQQGASALALSCALDLRSALERASNTLRQMQMHGLVQEAKKPLKTIRTLGAMLAPRLNEGEPERDMAEALIAQGESLARVVNQLQAALHPSTASLEEQSKALWQARMPANTIPSQKSLPKASTVRYPALPSSSIGGDYWGEIPNFSESDYEGGDPLSENNVRGDIQTVDSLTDLSDVSVVVSQLLRSAVNFATINGIALCPSAAIAGMSAVWIPVRPTSLKRALSQALDIMLQSSSNGDSLDIDLCRKGKELEIQFTLLKNSSPFKALPNDDDLNRFKDVVQRLGGLVQIETHEQGRHHLVSLSVQFPSV